QEQAFIPVIRADKIFRREMEGRRQLDSLVSARGGMDVFSQTPVPLIGIGHLGGHAHQAICLQEYVGGDHGSMNNHSLISTHRERVAQAYLISTLSRESCSRKASSSSPTTHSPTPGGVPVKMMSTMFSEKYWEILATIRSKLNSILPLFP